MGILNKHYCWVNFGIYGDNLAGVSRRITSVLSQSKYIKIVFPIGTNDFALGRTNDEIVGLFDEIMLKIQGILPSKMIFWCSILTTREIPNPPIERISEVNSGLELISRRYSQSFIKAFEGMLDSGGLLSGKYTTDGLHLSPAGYLQFAGILNKAVI